MIRSERGIALVPIIIGVLVLVGLLSVAIIISPKSQNSTSQKSNISPSPTLQATPKPTIAAKVTPTPKPTLTSTPTQKSSPSPTLQGQKGPLNPPRESKVEGVPIPFTAEDAGLKPPAKGSLVVQQEGYKVKEASYSELKDWYEGLMPKGQPWSSWWWCSDAPKGDQTFDQRTYGSFVREQLLVVTITADNPPGILISITDEGC